MSPPAQRLWGCSTTPEHSRLGLQPGSASQRISILGPSPRGAALSYSLQRRWPMILSLRLGVSAVVLAKLARAQPKAAGLFQNSRASVNNTRTVPRQQRNQVGSRCGNPDPPYSRPSVVRGSVLGGLDDEAVHALKMGTGVEQATARTNERSSPPRRDRLKQVRGAVSLLPRQGRFQKVLG